ncbi:hypothetical protein AAMO2058_000230300, partial [Amorphochlora amoebiformis]
MRRKTSFFRPSFALVFAGVMLGCSVSYLRIEDDFWTPRRLQSTIHDSERTARESFPSHTSQFDRIDVKDIEVPYLLGRQGSVRAMLQKMSGAKVSVYKGQVIIEGSTLERSVCKLAVEVLLQQRVSKTLNLDFQKIQNMREITSIDIPIESMGYLLGRTAQTLKRLGNAHRSFLFFNNYELDSGMKRLYILGKHYSRRGVFLEVRDIVCEKLRGENWMTDKDMETHRLFRSETRRYTPRRVPPLPPRYGPRDYGYPPGPRDYVQKRTRINTSRHPHRRPKQSYGDADRPQFQRNYRQETRRGYRGHSRGG